MAQPLESGSVRSPGEFIRDELKTKGWTQEDLARVLGRPLPTVNEVIQGKRAVMPEMAIALGFAFGTEAELWAQREATYRLSLAAKSAGCDVQRRAKIYATAPIKEMQKRGWIRQSDDMAVLEADLCRLMGVERVDDEPPLFGAMRKTHPNIAVTAAQKAWASRIRQVALAIPPESVAKYTDEGMEACFKGVRKLAAYSSEVKKVPSLLAAYGIRLVIVEGLSGAKVDGFATWLDSVSPVIGLSLRHDRLDSFWFTLAHEMSHIKHRDNAPIDGDASGDGDSFLQAKSPMESRADAESAATYVDPSELNSFIRRVGPVYTVERINQFANSIKMHPCVIIGQLKYVGAIGWSKFTKLNMTVREPVIRCAVTDGWGKTIELRG